MRITREDFLFWLWFVTLIVCAINFFTVQQIRTELHILESTPQVIREEIDITEYKIQMREEHNSLRGFIRENRDMIKTINDSFNAKIDRDITVSMYKILGGEVDWSYTPDGVDGLYNPKDDIFCVQVQGLTPDEVYERWNHELGHHLIDIDREHFIEGYCGDTNERR